MREEKLLTRLKSLVRRGRADRRPAEEETKTAKDERIGRLRGQLAEKDREFGELRARLERAEKGGGSGLEKSPVFFVVGRAKSGTSWLMKILDSHPEILCRGEGRFFGRDFIQEAFERGQQGRIQPSSLYRALLEAHYLEAWIERSVWTRGDDVGEHLARLTRLSTDYFLTQKLSKSGKRIVGDKTPLLSDEILEEIGAIYPDAKVVHIIRDGRDVAVSLMHHRWNLASAGEDVPGLRPEELARRDAHLKDPGRPTGAREGLFPEGMLEGFATGWRDQISKTRNDGSALLGANYTEVKYESLLEEPEEQTRRLLRFLGADAAEETARECVRSASFEKLSKGRRRGEEDATSFFRKGIAGDWRNAFTEADRRAFKEVAGDLLIELGYEKDHDW